MLDDLKKIHELDQQDALGIAEKEGAQLIHEFTLAGKSDFRDIHNIVYGAMGGSALAALLLRTWPQLVVPFEVVREYSIPSYVDEKTLFIAASYSGNTEETISAIAEAEAKGAQVAVIAGGGKLQQIAEEKGYLFAQLPKAEQPRYAVLYNFRALLQVLEAAGVLHEDYRPAMATTAQFLNNAVHAWRPDVPAANNPAKQIAQELVGKSVVVYGGPKMYPAAYKWKISCNENAKHIAWVNQYPELNHNEFIGWSKQPVDKPYAVIELRSHFEHERVQKRFVVTGRLLSGMRPSPIVINAEGATVLEQLLWCVLFGDFVTIYLAILNGLN
ncbi:MAG: bifunctional phosphoglucose/phosphomannose isomerase, partial [Candidatus Micrarchaeaceae archaeon]